MRVHPPYPKFPTENIFNNTWQSIRGQYIRFTFYLSNELYHVGCRYKFPQHRLTQQVYLPVQVLELQISPEPTQSGISSQTSPFLLLPSSLALIGSPLIWAWPQTPTVSSWGDEGNPSLNSAHVKGSPPFNICHLTLHLISIWHQNLPYIDFSEHLIKTFPLTSILASILSWSDLTNVSEEIPVFLCKQF